MWTKTQSVWLVAPLAVLCYFLVPLQAAPPPHNIHVEGLARAMVTIEAQQNAPAFQAIQQDFDRQLVAARRPVEALQTQITRLEARTATETNLTAKIATLEELVTRKQELLVAEIKFDSEKASFEAKLIQAVERQEEEAVEEEEKLSADLKKLEASEERLGDLQETLTKEIEELEELVMAEEKEVNAARQDVRARIDAFDQNMLPRQRVLDLKNLGLGLESRDRAERQRTGQAEELVEEAATEGSAMKEQQEEEREIFVAEQIFQVRKNVFKEQNQLQDLQSRLEEIQAATASNHLRQRRIAALIQGQSSQASAADLRDLEMRKDQARAKKSAIENGQQHRLLRSIRELAGTRKALTEELADPQRAHDRTRFQDSALTELLDEPQEAGQAKQLALKRLELTHEKEALEQQLVLKEKGRMEIQDRMGLEDKKHHRAKAKWEAVSTELSQLMRLAFFNGQVHSREDHTKGFTALVEEATKTVRKLRENVEQFRIGCVDALKGFFAQMSLRLESLKDEVLTKFLDTIQSHCQEEEIFENVMRLKIQVMATSFTRSRLGMERALASVKRGTMSTLEEVVQGRYMVGMAGQREIELLDLDLPAKFNELNRILEHPTSLTLEDSAAAALYQEILLLLRKAKTPSIGHLCERVQHLLRTTAVHNKLIGVALGKLQCAYESICRERVQSLHELYHHSTLWVDLGDFGRAKEAYSFEVLQSTVYFVSPPNGLSVSEQCREFSADKLSPDQDTLHSATQISLQFNQMAQKLHQEADVEDYLRLLATLSTLDILTLTLHKETEEYFDEFMEGLDEIHRLMASSEGIRDRPRRQGLVRSLVEQLGQAQRLFKLEEFTFEVNIARLERLTLALEQRRDFSFSGCLLIAEVGERLRILKRQHSPFSIFFEMGIQSLLKLMKLFQSNCRHQYLHFEPDTSALTNELPAIMEEQLELLLSTVRLSPLDEQELLCDVVFAAIDRVSMSSMASATLSKLEDWYCLKCELTGRHPLLLLHPRNGDSLGEFSEEGQPTRIIMDNTGPAPREVLVLMNGRIRRPLTQSMQSLRRTR